MSRWLTALALASLVAGCAGIETVVAPPPAEESEVRATLLYIERLHEAGSGELAVIGERLAGERGVQARVRRALWQAMPGHPGHAPQQAARSLAGLLDESEALDETTRLLLLVQLEHLRERKRLLESRAELMSKNEELRRQIEELTALERRMGGETGNGQ